MHNLDIVRSEHNSSFNDSYFGNEETSSVLSHLPNEILEEILDRLDWKSLCNFSGTNLANHTIVWDNQKYVKKMIGQKTVEKFLNREKIERDSHLKNTVSSLLGIDTKAAISLLNQIKDPKTLCSALIGASIYLEPEAALSYLNQAFKCCGQYKNPEYQLKEIVYYATPLNLKFSKKVAESIDKTKESEYLYSKFFIAEYSDMRQRTEICEEIYEQCKKNISDLYFIVFEINNLLQSDWSKKMVELTIDELTDIGLLVFISQTLSNDPDLAAKAALKINPHHTTNLRWSASTLCDVASSCYSTQPEISKELIKRVRDAVKIDEYENPMDSCVLHKIAEVVFLWDPEEANKINLKTAQDPGSVPIYEQLAKYDPEGALKEAYKIEDPLFKANAYLYIAKVCPDKREELFHFAYEVLQKNTGFHLHWLYFDTILPYCTSPGDWGKVTEAVRAYGCSFSLTLVAKFLIDKNPLEAAKLFDKAHSHWESKYSNTGDISILCGLPRLVPLTSPREL